MKKVSSAVLTLFVVVTQFLLAGVPPEVSLEKGEIWITQEQKPKKQLSSTAGKVDGYTVSESGVYLVAHKIIGQTEDPDDTLPDDQQPMASTYSLLFFDLRAGKLIRELAAPEDLLHIGKWNDNDVYRFTTGSMLDVTATYEYEPKANRLWKMEFNNDTGQYQRGSPTNR